MPGMEFQAHKPFLVLTLALMLAFVGSDLVPSGPGVSVHNGSLDQIEQLEQAVAAFEDAGLELPPVDVWFPDEPDSCHHSHGLFTASEEIMQIWICSTESEWVYLHELAHAWERANVTVEQRLAFLELLGLKHWRSRDVPWSERGVERAAVVIQQGLAGLSLPPVISNEMVSRLKGFEILTGQVAPILIEWTGSHEVPCDERPTDLSRPLTDANGLECS